MRCTRLILMVAALACLLQVASAAPEIFIEPSGSMVANGNNFTVNVKVDPMGSEVTTALYTLQFDNTHLRAISQTPGTFLSQDGEETKVDKNEINNTAGTVTYGEYIEDEPDDDTFGMFRQGTLASITFEAISDDGTGGLNFTNPKLAVVVGRDVGSIFVTYLYADDINLYNGSYTVSPYPKGDLNHNHVAADIVDVVMMVQASVGDITPNSEYDLNNNGGYADIVDVVMMVQASVGDITL